MQPHPDVPFVVSGLDSAIFEAWTRSGLRSANRAIDVMHPDRLVNLRSLVRRKPLISVDELIEEGNILDNQERQKMAPKAIGSRRAGRASNKGKEMAREVQGAIEVLKKHIEGMDVSDEEFEEDRANQIPSEEASVCLTRYSPFSGVNAGPSLSTKLNYILSEVCLYSCIDYLCITSCAFAGPATLCEGEILDILQLSSYALPSRRGLVVIRRQVSTVHQGRAVLIKGAMHHDV